MAESQSVSQALSRAGLLVLGVDTCGTSGTVALARIAGGEARILRQKELAGRTYSATLVAAVGELLTEHGVHLRNVGAIVVVHGPGSFTGVRVGLSAVKGLAEPGRIPVVALSRLEVLAAKAGVESAALDAHRREVFLRLEEPDGSTRELLAGAEDLSQASARGVETSPVPKGEGPGAPRSGGATPRPTKVAVCDEAAEALLGSAWQGTELVQSDAPTAADAIELCVGRILAGEFADVALLDGHYLRRSDAEIFGDSAKSAAGEEPRVKVRRMVAGDVDRVVDLAARTQHAPGWQRRAYETAIDPESRPRRIALVAEERSTGVLAGYVVASSTAPEAELESIVTAAAHQRRGVARELFSALKAELRRQGVREVMLEVRAGNQGAHGFYRFLGFAEEGRRLGYYSDPPEDAVLMRLRLQGSY
jgi:tRNA threonylcarbamoyladenosine biosynthesis protein TsaB